MARNPGVSTGVCKKPVPGVVNVPPRIFWKTVNGDGPGAVTVEPPPSQLISRRPPANGPGALPLLGLPSWARKASTVPWMPAAFEAEDDETMGAAWVATVLRPRSAAAKAAGIQRANAPTLPVTLSVRYAVGTLSLKNIVFSCVRQFLRDPKIPSKKRAGPVDLGITMVWGRMPRTWRAAL